VSPAALACPHCGQPLQTAQPAAPAPQKGGTSGRNFAYYSIICAVVSILIFPLPLAILGVVFGILAIRRGEVRLGALGVVLSVVFGVVGVIAGILAVL